MQWFLIHKKEQEFSAKIQCTKEHKLTIILMEFLLTKTHKAFKTYKVLDRECDQWTPIKEPK